MAMPMLGPGCATQAAPAACLRDGHVAAVGSGPQRARQADAAVGAGAGLHPDADVKALLPAAASPSGTPRHQERGQQLHLPQAAGRRVAACRHQHLRTSAAIMTTLLRASLSRTLAENHLSNLHDFLAMCCTRCGGGLLALTTPSAKARSLHFSRKEAQTALQRCKAASARIRLPQLQSPGAA